MMRYWSVLTLAICFLIRATALTPARALPSPADFPLTPGNYWVYEGLVKWTDGSTIKSKRISWTMEVLEVISRDHITATVLKGFPSDLAWYDEQTTPGDYLLIRIGTNRYYLLGGEAQKKALTRLRDASDPLKDLVDVNELILDLPLTPGKRFGDPEMLKRRDGWYCWHVETKWQRTLNEITGIPPQKYTGFQLAFRTGPDHQLIQFVPGIGITGYTYVHHGTIAEVYLKLVKFGTHRPGVK